MRHKVIIWSGCVVVCLLAGCRQLAPPATPPQLNAPPGTSIVITNEWVDAGIFRAHYPAGWRVVKANAAAAPPVMVLVSPDEAITITLYAEVDDSTLSDAAAVETVIVDGVTITVVLHAPDEQIDTARSLFEQVVASIVSSG